MSRKKPHDHLTIKRGPATEDQMMQLLAALVDVMESWLDQKEKCPTCKRRGLTAAQADVIRKTLRDQHVKFDPARRAGMSKGLAELKVLTLPFLTPADTKDKDTLQ